MSGKVYVNAFFAILNHSLV